MHASFENDPMNNQIKLVVERLKIFLNPLSLNTPDLLTAFKKILSVNPARKIPVFTFSVEAGFTELVTAILPMIDIDDCFNKNFVLAANKGFVEIVSTLFPCILEENIRQEALCEAARNGQAAVIQYLIVNQGMKPQDAFYVGVNDGLRNGYATRLYPFFEDRKINPEIKGRLFFVLISRNVDADIKILLKDKRVIPAILEVPALQEKHKNAVSFKFFISNEASKIALIDSSFSPLTDKTMKFLEGDENEYQRTELQKLIDKTRCKERSMMFFRMTTLLPEIKSHIINMIVQTSLNTETNNPPLKNDIFIRPRNPR